MNSRAQTSTDLYHVLGVDRRADQDTIRNAYKTLARRWHPDRNLSNPDEAEIRFKEIQTAFEILSNENERAWYDANQQKILKSGISSTGDSGDPSGVNLYQFFSLSCFNGFGDDASGFYFVFGSAFASIGEIEEISVPQFGDSASSWSRVNKFYSFWGNFNTRRKFRWAAKFNLNDATNRRERGMMKKANAKAMEDCRREWEGNVRRLVRFARSLDPRVRHQALQERDAERREEEENLVHARAVAEVMERRRARDLEIEVDRLERTMLPPDVDSSPPRLACLICRRKFRSQKTLMTHKMSAKHIQRAKRLKQHMRREEQIILGMDSGATEQPQMEDERPIPREEQMMTVEEEVDEACTDASRAPPPAPGAISNELGMNDDTESVGGNSVISGFSDFVLVEELDDVEDDVSEVDDDDGVDIEMWDSTIALETYSDNELEVIDVDLLDGVIRRREDFGRATEEARAVEDDDQVEPDVSLDLLLAQQLASGVGISGEGVDGSVLAQLADPTNLDRLLALQLEQEDLMARRAIARDDDVNAIHSDDDGYDSELDTLVDALSAKMISLDDPNVNVKDLEKRLERAIARSGSKKGGKKSRRSKKKKKSRAVGRGLPGQGGAQVSSDEAEEGVDEFLNSFRKGKEAPKTKKELRGERKRRRRRRLANDPQSTSRCAVCHRGFASKAKLNRHIEANPAHVRA